MLLVLVTSWPCFKSSIFSSSRLAEWWMLRSTIRNACLSWYWRLGWPAEFLQGYY